MGKYSFLGKSCNNKFLIMKRNYELSKCTSTIESSPQNTNEFNRSNEQNKSQKSR